MHRPCVEILNDKAYKWGLGTWDRGKVWIHNGEVVGFYVLRVNDEVEIVRLIVDFDFRGQGIGTALFKDVLNFGKDVKIIVEEHDNYAIEWLRRKHFKGIGVRKGYFPSSDGYLLRRVTC